MGMIEEFQAAVRQVADGVGTSVVGVGRAGSGVVVGQGLVATNAHNLREGPVTVTFADGREAEGSVSAVDIDADLAVIAVDTAGWPAVTWAEAMPEVGTVVFALAKTGGRVVRTTMGTVSSVGSAFRGPRGRQIAGSIEHTAPLARGSSGGPIANAEGKVIGINTHRLGEGFYLALPADQALIDKLSALGRGEAPHRVRLGVAIAPSHAARRLRAAVGLPARDGLLVRGVEDNSPGGRAGLRQGDLIVSAGGHEVTSFDQLQDALETVETGGSIDLGIVRGTEELTANVSFGEGTRQEGSA
jgi:serine protease Do